MNDFQLSLQDALIENGDIGHLKAIRSKGSYSEAHRPSGITMDPHPSSTPNSPSSSVPRLLSWTARIALCKSSNGASVANGNTPPEAQGHHWGQLLQKQDLTGNRERGASGMDLAQMLGRGRGVLF